MLMFAPSSLPFRSMGGAYGGLADEARAMSGRLFQWRRQGVLAIENARGTLAHREPVDLSATWRQGEYPIPRNRSHTERTPDCSLPDVQPFPEHTYTPRSPRVGWGTASRSRFEIARCVGSALTRPAMGALALDGEAGAAASVVLRVSRVGPRAICVESRASGVKSEAWRGGRGGRGGGRRRGVALNKRWRRGWDNARTRRRAR